jgi:PPOX class probable F420-dependent enzyme
MLTEEQRRFLDEQRVARLATADAAGRPHVIPICFALSEDCVYFTIDKKPKRASRAPLKRIANMVENPHVALVVDRYDEDWSKLGWVMLRGRAEVLESGREHDRAQKVLKRRYPQLGPMEIEGLPVIAIRIERASGWGALGPSEVE